MKRSNSMNITVIFTGGTIGSSVQQDFVSTDAQMPYRLLAMYEAEQKKNGAAIPSFRTQAPYTTLSEYMDGSHLNRLIACVQSLLTTDDPDIDGIIITHGTDTLPFTAAALGMCFAYAEIPILLVSSNYILDDPRANGLTNFTAAVDFITSPTLPTAVGIAYCNTGSTPKIYNALGVYNHYPFDDSLYERSYDAYADAIAPVLQEFSDLRQTSVHFDTTCPVCFFQAMPGMQYHLPDDARAVLIHAYHSGTINTKDASLLALTGQAAQKDPGLSDRNLRGIHGLRQQGSI